MTRGTFQISEELLLALKLTPDRFGEELRGELVAFQRRAVRSPTDHEGRTGSASTTTA
jgi:hypothetical protein